LRLFATVLSVSAVSYQFTDHGNGVCTLAGCDSNVYFEVFETPDGSSLIEATLRICRNDLCSEARISELPTVMEYQGPTIRLQGDLGAVAYMYSLPAGYTVTVTVGEQGEFPYGLADGDVYTLALHDRDAALLNSQAWTATYSVLEPNGHDCGPTCLRASLVPR